ncbi:thiol-disulfide oxidoreductase DCC family protein [Kyrpidia tusciae]|uniref:Thiol-disulfide oxidoreductase DCC n=1 Tax=Kyrpidia tusciae (strain DSM 2912 / NBRC 15312 / T2) TaxID=562970 RepID=D5WVX1_KYRT2|nr:DCC1-like thiol-disulfide oxidoreductase family protein [Kyrpidia tusciae]ADG05603.1 putative thiol-disulfide oxidoreductase DCC [Kyrpidia tusciae DSM 2912]
MTVYYDGYCPYCRAAAMTIRSLDVFRRIAVISFRHDKSYSIHGITAEELEREMVVIVHCGDQQRAYKGFAGVLAVLRGLLLLWPIFPLAWCLGRIGWGDVLYRWMAEHRLIIPDAGHCRDRNCRI